MSRPRAENPGSLLRPAWLLELRRRERDGRAGEAEARAGEDRAILEAIRLQESLGLDVITDGEMRRTSWIGTARGAVDGFESRAGGPGWQWRGTAQAAELSQAPFPFVVRPIGVRYSLAEREYAFLRRHTRARTKLCLPAPSYHRTVWHPQHSSDAYPRCEDFLVAMRDVVRSMVREATALGCDYVQLDAPNYGSLCDAGHRRQLEAQGRDLDAELAFDVALDSSLLEGFEGITRALHVCRGNAAGRWHSTGGYAVIAEQLFPRLAVDALLLEYDSDRSGDFAPLACVPSGVVAVLGLLTTKTGAVEEDAAVEARIAEAATVKPLAELALSPQCGFASVAVGNPVTPDEQRAKLAVVGRVARRVWA